LYDKNENKWMAKSTGELSIGKSKWKKSHNPLCTFIYSISFEHSPAFAMWLKV
jgi:hypothetical protein